MEFIGRTVIRDGKEVEEFVLRCPTHNWFYNARPPITHGCEDCWLVYYTGQLAQAEGDKKTLVDQLESAIRHTAEHAKKGTWDFKPHLEINIEKDAN